MYRDKSILQKLAAESKSKKELALKLGMKVKADDYKKITYFLRKYNINVDHFVRATLESRPYIKHSLVDILKENSKYFNKTSLKRRLLTNKLLEYRCHNNECTITETWCGKSLPLQLDHINGIGDDNRIENLRFLCPNCHSQTGTYGGKNQKK